MKSLKILELFSGTESFSKVARKRGVIPRKLCLEIIKACENGKS